jgi:hypothetical protein
MRTVSLPAGNVSLGSAGCQPAVAGNLPATFMSTRFNLARERLGKLTRRTGQRPVLPRELGFNPREQRMFCR